MTRNIFIFYVIEILNGLKFYEAILVLFFVKTLGFDDSTAVLLSTLIFFFKVIFELPTGAVADRLGRKKSYIVGLIINLIGISFYLFNTVFLPFVFSALLIGLGVSLQSGSIEALLSDNEKKSEKNFFAIGHGMFFFARFLSMLISGILFIINPILPFILFIIVLFFKIIAVLFIDEKIFEKSKEKTNFKQIVSTIREIKNNSDLLSFAILVAFFIGTANIFWHIYQILLPNLGLTDSQIGYVYALGAFTSGVSSYFVSKVKGNEHKILLNMILTTSISILCFLTGNIVFVILGHIFISIVFAYQQPVSFNYFGRKISSKNKATAFSILSMSGTLAFVTTGLYASFCLKFLSLEFYYISVFFLVIVVYLLGSSYYLKSNKIEN